MSAEHCKYLQRATAALRVKWGLAGIACAALLLVVRHPENDEISENNKYCKYVVLDILHITCILQDRFLHNYIHIKIE